MEYNVAVEMKIYIQDNSHIPKIKEEIGKIAKVQKFEEVELAFGLKALKAVVLFNDAGGGMSELEEKIKNIENVSELEVENVSRIG